MSDQTVEVDLHQKKHQILHDHLDELAGDYIRHKQKLLSETTVVELIEWSHKQTISPDDPQTT